MSPDDSGRLFDEPNAAHPRAKRPHERGAAGPGADPGHDAGTDPATVAADISRTPLAERMRPRSLQEFIGQERLTGTGRLLRRMLEGGELASIILWGPPGCGKTTLARLIAAASDAGFVALSAVLSGVKDVRQVGAEASELRRRERRTILFIDEIHRFNKAQQDAFLPYVESGDIVLIGATTENPSFALVAPLLSRCKVVTLEPLSQDEVVAVLEAALATPAPRGLGGEQLEVDDEQLGALAAFADGDARVALNTLEIASRLARSASGGATRKLTAAVLIEAMQRKTPRYDRAGEEHFNLISALHKSVRNSDPDASLYWLARILAGGEDPRYVARRLIRMASEDIGLADPQALPLAVAGIEAVNAIGMPECALALAEVAVYLALAPKSDAVYRGYEAARSDAESGPSLPVPLQLRNAPTRLMKELGYGKGYEHAHEAAEGITAMTCLPDGLSGRRYFAPSGRGHEELLGARLREVVELRRRLQHEQADCSRSADDPDDRAAE